MPSGESVKEIRARLGLTQPELAKLTAYSPSAIARYETRTRQPSRRFLRRLAEVERMVSQPGHVETLFLGASRNAGTVELRLTAIESRLGRLESLLGQVLDLVSQRNTQPEPS
ncbi:MAG: helix-turn-helix transcriptional regulator [Acidobacteria bacterium]|nr:helix-turn-helix transcriptional regulator [Acidobacteriota bacterium]